MADFRDRSAMLLEELLDSGFRVEDAERLRDLLTVGCRNSAIEELKEKRESLFGRFTRRSRRSTASTPSSIRSAGVSSEKNPAAA